MPGTTPVYGFPYPEPTDLVADYPALGQDLAEDIEAVLPTLGGLSPATPTSIANSGGTATLSGNTVTCTGVTSVSLNGCFTSTYSNYRIVVAASQATSNAFMVLRLRAAGTDNTSAVYAWQRHIVSTGGSAVVSSAVTATSWNAGTIGTAVSGVVVELQSPQTNTRTAGQVVYAATLAATIPEMGVFGLFHDAAYQADGFTLSSTYAITGTVAVYGYKK